MENKTHWQELSTLYIPSWGWFLLKGNNDAIEEIESQLTDSPGKETIILEKARGRNLPGTGRNVEIPVDDAVEAVRSYNNTDKY